MTKIQIARLKALISVKTRCENRGEMERWCECQMRIAEIVQDQPRISLVDMDFEKDYEADQTHTDAVG